jgi:hypothetical protein
VGLKFTFLVIALIWAVDASAQWREVEAHITFTGDTVLAYGPQPKRGFLRYDASRVRWAFRWTEEGQERTLPLPLYFGHFDYEFKPRESLGRLHSITLLTDLMAAQVFALPGWTALKTVSLVRIEMSLEQIRHSPSATRALPMVDAYLPMPDEDEGDGWFASGGRAVVKFQKPRGDRWETREMSVGISRLFVADSHYQTTLEDTFWRGDVASVGAGEVAIYPHGVDPEGRMTFSVVNEMFEYVTKGLPSLTVYRAHFHQLGIGPGEAMDAVGEPPFVNHGYSRVLDLSFENRPTDWPDLVRAIRLELAHQSLVTYSFPVIRGAWTARFRGWCAWVVRRLGT